MSKFCPKCKFDKRLDEFAPSQQTKSGAWCRSCNKIYRKSHYENNKDKYVSYAHDYYQDNKEQLDAAHAAYYEEHKEDISEYWKEWSSLHKKEKSAYDAQYVAMRRLTDPVYKLRQRISNSVLQSIKKNGKKKLGSILKHLPYTIEEMKAHLESQFETWMSWDNWGIYQIDKWNNDDPNTWCWQIDHIVPQSELLFTSMEDENFKKCWALENLRPLSAKQNLLDGVLKIRH